MPNKKNFQIFTYAGLFAVAMGLMEAIVVVYLRKLYYSQGFNFPLQTVPSDMLSLELVREICTVVMLTFIALIAGKNKLQKFAWFIYCFAIWDIFYYVGLKLFLNWPPSLFTWDILFLIPIPWVGPVIAPVICSLTMILLAACIVVLQEKGYEVHIKRREWALILSGGFIIFIAFIWDTTRFIIQKGYLGKLLIFSVDQRFLQVMAQYRPVSFVWLVFILGEILILAAITLMTIRIKNPEPDRKIRNLVGRK
jgi:hypothetical protein